MNLRMNFTFLQKKTVEILIESSTFIIKNKTYMNLFFSTGGIWWVGLIWGKYTNESWVGLGLDRHSGGKKNRTNL